MVVGGTVVGGGGSVVVVEAIIIGSEALSGRIGVVLGGWVTSSALTATSSTDGLTSDTATSNARNAARAMVTEARAR